MSLCMHLLACSTFYYTMAFLHSCGLVQSPPYLQGKLHLSVSLLLRLHRSLLIQGSDFLLLVTVLSPRTHSLSIRTGFLLLSLLASCISLTLLLFEKYDPDSFFLFFFSKDNFLKLFLFFFFFLTPFLCLCFTIWD